MSTRSVICPVCASALEMRAGGMARCPEGHGTALTRDAVGARFPPHLHRQFDDVMRGHAVHRACPVCRRRMARGVVAAWRSAGDVPTPMDFDIDGCPDCGVFWFDAGETLLHVFPPPGMDWGTAIVLDSVDAWLKGRS